MKETLNNGECHQKLYIKKYYQYSRPGQHTNVQENNISTIVQDDSILKVLSSCFCTSSNPQNLHKIYLVLNYISTLILVQYQDPSQKLQQKNINREYSNLTCSQVNSTAPSMTTSIFREFAPKVPRTPLRKNTQSPTTFYVTVLDFCSGSRTQKTDASWFTFYVRVLLHATYTSRLQIKPPPQKCTRKMKVPRENPASDGEGWYLCTMRTGLFIWCFQQT